MRFTTDEEQAILRAAASDPVAKIAASLGRHVNSVRAVLKRHGVRAAYGRARHGHTSGGTRSTTHVSKLSAAEVAAMRARADEGCAVLGREFGISKTLASQILRGLKWAA